MPFDDSILAIQNGAYVIPDDMAHVYSRKLNLFVRYMLEIDINIRPDIWQVSYITYKLLGINCPIPNRCQSKIPDLNSISMPLKDGESRHQRTTSLSKSKSTSTNLKDDSLSLGATVNPSERPRAMVPLSKPLINFDQTTQQSRALTIHSAPSSSSSSSSLNTSRSGSAAELKFDDDFSQIPSHAISLTNITTATTTTAKIEQIPSRARRLPPATISAASSPALQQQLLPSPPPSKVHSHRRSASQTITSTNNQSSFHNASSIDLSNQNEISSDDEDELISLKNQKSKSTNHYPSTEEMKKVISSSINELTTTNLNYSSNSSFDDDDQQKSSNNERRNPFLHALFHHLPASKQTPASTFDPNSIMIGKRTSAFTPYQKHEINSPTIDVFTNAPFDTKSKTKQRNDQKRTMMTDNELKQNVFSNLSFHNPMVNDYF